MRAKKGSYCKTQDLTAEFQHFKTLVVSASLTKVYYFCLSFLSSLPPSPLLSPPFFLMVECNIVPAFSTKLQFQAPLIYLQI